jgi:hypothetical protein
MDHEYRRLEPEADTKVFPKRVRVSHETRIGDLKQKLYKMVRHAMSDKEADDEWV